MYIRKGQVNNSLTKRIEEAVEKGRKNQMLRSEYMKERQLLMEVKEEGREEGREEKEKAIKRAEKAEAEIVELRKEIERVRTVPKA